ncbi:hypothetical protein Tco_1238336 [Tanacetum coccineum]
MKYSNGHNYMHLNWITVRRDDDKLYKFKEGKLTNLTVEERLAFNVSLRMFTRSIVIQRRVEDLQLGVESYQKKLKPHQCRMDTTALKDSSIGELGGNICTQTIWKQHDKDNARAMIQSSDKQLKTRRIMRSLEKFVGGWRTIKVKEFQRSFRHSDTERLSRSDEVLKLKNFKKDATLKLFKSTNQERCSRSHSRQAKEQAQDLKSMITTSNHKLMIEVKRAQD